MRDIIRWFPQLAKSGIAALLLLPLAGLSQGCEDGTGPQLAQVQIQLTDAPADAIAMAEVWISRVYLQGCMQGEEGAEEECGAVDLFNDPETPLYYDLLTLQDGATAELTDMVNVEAKVYRQLRLVVDSAKVTLKDGYTFEGAEGAANVAILKVPSGASSGIKVQLLEAIDADTEEVTVVLVDFAVADNFVLQGTGEGNVLKGVIFTPTLKEKSRSN